MFLAHISEALNIPEYYDEPVENVESVLDVTKRTVTDDLEQHLEGKYCTEEYITVLQDQRQRFGLEKVTRQ